MSHNLYDIALHNLYCILQSDEESFRKNDFQDLEGRPLWDKDEIIDFLVNNDLIEYESDEQRYFLAPDTYDLLESGKIENRLWQFIGQEEREKYIALSQQKDERKSRLKKMELSENEVSKAPFLSKVSKRTLAVILSALVSIIYVVIHFNDDPVEDKINLILESDNIIFTNENGDTLDPKDLPINFD